MGGVPAPAGVGRNGAGGVTGNPPRNCAWGLSLSRATQSRRLKLHAEGLPGRQAAGTTSSLASALAADAPAVATGAAAALRRPIRAVGTNARYTR